MVKRLALLSLPLLLAALSACDIATAEFNAEERAEWRKSYELSPGGRVEVLNVNGKIDVTPAEGNTLEIVAQKTARASSAEAARQLLEQTEIADAASADAVRVETKAPRGAGFLRLGNAEVRYTVKVPASANVHFRTVNGGIELAGLNGRVNAETTNGGIRAIEVGGPIAATTTNGGVEVELTRVTQDGASLQCTNGGLRLRLPSDARATISASVTNGGIQTDGLPLQASQSSRRRLEAQLNGGGPRILLEGTNGGIRIGSR